MLQLILKYYESRQNNDSKLKVLITSENNFKNENKRQRQLWHKGYSNNFIARKMKQKNKGMFFLFNMPYKYEKHGLE